ncbi:MAG TPA: Hpt domain-containing protein [Acidobacteriota bacterium]|jgi:HPt (histidine-containing phosphotransfer) domain-containing protein
MEEILDELIDCFLDTAPARLLELRAAVQGGDAEEIRRLAHNLRGASATLDRVASSVAGGNSFVEADCLIELCTMFESACSAGSLEGSEVLLSKLENEFERVRQRLSSRRRSKAGLPSDGGSAE